METVWKNMYEFIAMQSQLNNCFVFIFHFFVSDIPKVLPYVSLT